ncbi:MAG: hypothetical protein V7700_17525 [Halioglobus sp.]
MDYIEYRGRVISYGRNEDDWLEGSFSLDGAKVYGIKMSEESARAKGMRDSEDLLLFLVSWLKAEVDMLIPGDSYDLH